MNKKFDWKNFQLEIKRRWKKILQDLIIFFSSWTYLIAALFKRFYEGFRNIDFIIYFLVVILIVGGLGISPIAYKIYYKGENNPENILELAKALSTYFITIIATSSADLILNKLPNHKEARSLRMPALTFLILGGIAIFLVQYDLLPDYSLEIAFYATISALFLWWITNSVDKKYKLEDKDDDSAAPIGGPYVDLTDNAQEIPNVKM
ncbi:hypothetical protein [Pedobacter psychroterrae]|uniref:Uncharacterized protein n=1 Tax=Pedobacter psychroterrae TaxID=2530453 RepID=A0A4R0NKV5_9SPHI|nr:hypothetical protein [Pedobacter psychroterrae]TCD01226.1 hypothetical protein EZ437_10745 [Pedobacter psychroterrae]